MSVTITSLLDDINARISKGQSNKDFNLLYKAINEVDVDDFHKKCDNKGPTVTIFYGKYDTLFGGYTSKPWSSKVNRRVKDKDAFLFTKYMHVGAECIFLPVKKTDMAITCDARFGPTFGAEGLFASFDLQAFKKDAKKCYHADGYLHLNGTLNINCAYSVERNPGYRGNADPQKIKSRDINAGTMIVERIEVYEVVDGELPNDWLPKLKEEEFVRKKQTLEEIEPLSGIDIKWYNILLVGVIGSGKSSFVNTLSTLFTGKVSHMAVVRNCKSSVTNRVGGYVLKSKREEPLKIRIFDIRGFERKRCYQHELELLLDGMLPIGYQFPDRPEVVPEEIKTEPILDNGIHLVCFVSDTLNFDSYTGELHEHFRNIKQTIAKKGLPMVVVATKFDQLCPKITKDVDHIYASPKAKRATSKTVDFFGVPSNHVFPVVNYVSETETNIGKDRLALKALYEMCQLIQEYLQNHEDKVEEPDEWTERKEMLPTLRVGNDKDITLKTVHDKLSEFENKKLLILVVGPTHSGKSSFIDSVLSTLQDDIVVKAVGACSASAQQEDVSSTETFELYPMKYKHESGRVTKSNVSFGDTPGFQEKEGITVDHVGYILKGNVPNKYKIIHGIQVANKDFKAHPTPGDKIHCVCLVFDCVTILEGFSERMKTTMQDVLRVVSKEDIPFVVILTKCDAVSEKVKRNKRRVFEDRRVKECKNILVETFGFKQKNIFPVVNYTQENKVDLEAVSLVIAAFKQILKFGKDVLETAEEEWSETPDCESRTSAVTGNDKRSLQLYKVPISCWPDVNQSKIRIRNMLNYCKSIEKNVGLKSEEEGGNIDNVDIYIDADVIEIESLLSGNTTFEKKNVQVLTISEATGKENLSNFKGVVIDSGGVKIIRSLLGSNATVNKADGYLNERDCYKPYKEIVRTETKYIIERAVFEPLIQKCEFLGHVIDILNAASINKVSHTSHGGERDQMSTNKSVRPKVSGKLDCTYQEKQEDIDKCFDEKTLEQFNQQRDAVEDLYEEMVAQISRGHLKEYDLTRLQDSRQSRYVSKEVLQELFQREKSVKGCGFRLKSFHVDIEELPTKEEHNDRERRIRDFLFARNINNVKFNFVSPKLAKYSYVGANVGLRCGSVMQTGTLGCFAKHSRCNKSDLCALFSKHVAQGCSEEILIRDEDQQFKTFGTLLSDTFVDGGHDIAAAKVYGNHIPSCDIGFKNVNGEKVPGELYNVGDTTNLQGHPIHLWGAKSKPGIGKITVQHYHFAQDTDTFIEVQDGCIALDKPDAVLAERGDSGAIVCMDESNGEKVKVISMLMGSTNETVSQEDPKVKRKYLTLPLSSGLQTLENRTHGKFHLEGAESSGTYSQPAQD